MFAQIGTHTGAIGSMPGLAAMSVSTASNGRCLIGASHKTTLPEISYEAAMKLTFPDGNGGMVTLKHIHATWFRQLCYEAAATSTEHKQLRHDLAPLLFRHKPDRWYACILLMRAGIDLASLGKEPAQTTEKGA